MNKMSRNYSGFERNLATFLNKFPYCKSKIKKIYQYINYLIFQTNETAVSNWKIKKIYKKQDEETFFGPPTIWAVPINDPP